LSTIEQQEPHVAKKKSGGPPKRYGTLIRVSQESAVAITRAASFEGLSVAEFVAQYLVPIAERRYRDAVLREARRMKGEEA
jgi:uncharacterized protein (DUF1778 family)